MASQLDILLRHNLLSAKDLNVFRQRLFWGDLLEWNWQLNKLVIDYSQNKEFPFTESRYQEILSEGVERERENNSIPDNLVWEDLDLGVWMGLVGTHFRFDQNKMCLLSIDSFRPFYFNAEYRQQFVPLIRQIQTVIYPGIKEPTIVFHVEADYYMATEGWEDFSADAYADLVAKYERPVPINKCLDQESLDNHPLALMGDYFFIDRGEDLSQITYEYVPPYVEEEDE